MAQQLATNVFLKGMVLDYNELDTSADVLVNALNATVTTFNGHEGMLQNDMGNIKIADPKSEVYAQLNVGYVPVGSVEYGGIYYIASVNSEERCEIGSMPCPNYKPKKDDGSYPLDSDIVNSGSGDYIENYYEEELSLQWLYSPLFVGLDSTDNTVPLNTKYLDFDLKHPVNIVAERSFDGSVNLILNDGVHLPRLINTGFHALDNGTCQIIKRYGSIKSNTNRYDIAEDEINSTEHETIFDLQTSLFRDTSVLSNFKFEGLTVGGQLQVGNYTFYAVTCDKDGNESDIIAESGVISVFKGTDGDPFSVNGGVENERTDKSIRLELYPIDSCYNYIKLYYTRTTAANNLSATTLAYKIDLLFPVNDYSGVRKCKILITGYETVIDTAISDLNILYFNADCAKALSLSLNMLFLGNIKEYNLDASEYEVLRDVSLHIVPTYSIDTSFNLTSDYNYSTDNKNSYYNSNFIYNNTGYHAGEIYRFGIVYIRADNSLTSVFNVCGVKEMLNINGHDDKNKIHYDPITTVTFDSDKYDISLPYFDNTGADPTNKIKNYNILGVSRIPDEAISSLTDIISISFTQPNFSSYSGFENNYKGYFFVRLKRIPTLLALGYATNVCETSFIPSINVDINDWNIITDPNTNKKTYTKDSDTISGYLYESFAKVNLDTFNVNYENGDIKNSNTSLYDSTSSPATSKLDYFPKTTSSEKGTYKLRNTYNRRLFTLSYNSYAYFDKYIGKITSYSTYWKELGQSFDASETYDGYGSDGYEIESFGEDDYLVVKTNNGTGEEHEVNNDNKIGRDYLQGLIFLKKVDAPSDTSVATISLTKLQYNGSSITFSDLKDKNNNSVTFDFTLGNDGYNVRGTSTSEITNADGTATTTEEYNCWEWGMEYEKLDWASHCFAFPALVLENIASYRTEKSIDTVENWGFRASNSNKVKELGKTDYHEVFEYYLINGNWYTVEKALWVSADYLSGITAAINTCIKNWLITDAANANALDMDDYASTSEVKGLDLDMSTFDGKFSVPDSEDTDYSASLCRPIEYNTFAVFCPEYELNLAYYNSIFTGGKVTSKWITDSKKLSTYYNTETGIEERRYVYNNTSVSNNGTIWPTFAIDVADNVNLLTINHRLNYGEPYYVRRLNLCYFSSKVGDGTEVSFKYAGPEYVAYNPPQKLTTEETTISLNYNISTPSPWGAIIGAAVNLGNPLGELTGAAIGDVIANNKSDQTENAKATKVIPEYKTINTRPFNIIRGSYGPYVGIYPQSCGDNEEGSYDEGGWEYKDDRYLKKEFNGSERDYADRIVSLYIPEYSTSDTSLYDYFNIRFNDSSSYYTISDRISINTETSTNCYRGDCFINWYTHRVNRNFNDSTAPYNDTIIDSTSFTSNFGALFDDEYRTFDLTKDADAASKINIGDLNAILLGSWVTFPVRSTMNTALRSDDASYTSEVLASGNNRSFYPLSMNFGGSGKLPESEAFNSGFNKSGGERLYFNLNQQVWNNTYYRNRIVYSNVLQQSSLENGHRKFLATHYKDYTDLYGEIVKMFDLSGNLLVVCEHGIMLIPVNERALGGEGSGGFVFINTSNVLPDTPKIISDTYGSTWVESIIKTPYGIFGIDVLSRKVWLTDGSSILLISDFKVLKFLNDYLALDTLEINSKNIKTHYNKFKNDVMFTLYNRVDDKYWNICYNINSSSWQTFYSWIPIDSLNIGNCFVTLPLILPDFLDSSTLSFYKHGQSNRVPPYNTFILPTYWYDELHPFEFEFVVRENALLLKIFENLQILSNKAEPESFHYEIVGESYKFSPYKKSAYYCQEQLKDIYELTNRLEECETPVFTPVVGNKDLQISFPQYYAHLDVINQIYDNYKSFSSDSYNYNYLSGTEVVWDKQRDEYRLWNHTKGVNMATEGLLRGNMRYKEDKWDVQINPIFFVERNTTSDMWYNKDGNCVGPVFINDIKSTTLDGIDFSKANAYVDNNTDNKRKSAKMRDKYIRIRIRYSGKDLVLISAIYTLYELSYA